MPTTNIRFDLTTHDSHAERAVFEHSVLATRAWFETSDGEATGEIGALLFGGTKFGEGRCCSSMWSSERGSVVP
jgi:hypothetical protein